MTDVTLQVSEAIALINETLDTAFPFVLIEGEVSSFKINQGKFVFFDIKDASGSLNCFMMAFALKFPIEDGMKVRVLAQPKITSWGKFSLTVREIMPVGEGSLKKSFEILKAKLTAEGLFEESRKRSLPLMPTRIGVVSSSQAAGYADFIKILSNRWGGLEVILVDVPVQGIEAPAQLVGAIKHVNQLAEPIDVLAVLRGGGSADDLAAFNHEDVVRAIATSRAPVVVGVGHEVDTSLADLAADVRAATPSNAAEILVPEKDEKLHFAQRVVETAKSGALAAINVFEQDRAAATGSITKSLSTFFVQKEETITQITRTLTQLDPRVVLRRGYSLVKTDGRILSRATDAIIGQNVTLEFLDGDVGAKVTDVTKK